ncbi:MAG: rhomboid family intramembrane serine protease [Armatimonadota bacterium]
MLIPYATERDLKRTPYVTYVLVALNVVVFLGVFALVQPETTAGVAVRSSEPSEEAGPEVPEGIIVPEEEEEAPTEAVERVERNAFEVAALRFGFVPGSIKWYTIVTAMFLHGGLLHLLFNMLFLWIFGRHVEDALGSAWFALLYFSSGIAALLLHYVMTLAFARQDMGIAAIGASGAIAGVLGLFAVRFYRTGVLLTVMFLRSVALPAIVFLGIWLAQEVWAGVSAIATASATHTSVANWAHIGGFLYGMLMALVLHLETEAGEEYLLKDAEEALAIGNWEKVIEGYSDVLVKEPENLDAHIALAKAYGMTRDDERSVYHYHTAISLLAQRSEPRQTMLIYRDYTQMFPDRPLPPNLRYQIGCACEVGGDPATAHREFSAILEIEPPPAEAQMALLKKAQITLRNLHRPQEAIKLFEEFLAKFGDSMWAVAAQDGIQEAQGMISGQRPPPVAGPGTGPSRFPGR